MTRYGDDVADAAPEIRGGGDVLAVRAVDRRVGNAVYREIVLSQITEEEAA